MLFTWFKMAGSDEQLAAERSEMDHLSTWREAVATKEECPLVRQVEAFMAPDWFSGVIWSHGQELRWR
jgi:hypothetical protein